MEDAYYVITESMGDDGNPGLMHHAQLSLRPDLSAGPELRIISLDAGDYDKYHVQLENGTRSGPPEIESAALDHQHVCISRPTSQSPEIESVPACSLRLEAFEEQFRSVCL
jgi:hypothetical protein